jgi:hypothetical protein
MLAGARPFPSPSSAGGPDPATAQGGEHARGREGRGCRAAIHAAEIAALALLLLVLGAMRIAAVRFSPERRIHHVA